VARRGKPNATGHCGKPLYRWAAGIPRRVKTSRTRPVTRPFLRVNPADTDLRRIDTAVSTHTVRLSASDTF
jgi:hypothetical protein